MHYQIKREESPNYEGMISPAEFELSNEMRRVWQEHVVWTRLYIISLAEHLKDTEATGARLLQNAKDLANIFQKYYGSETAAVIENLVTEHLTIASDLVKALMAGDTAAANDLNQKWYANADEMAKAFSSINPYYNYSEIRQMLYDHLNLTTQEVAGRLKGDYANDPAIFDRIAQQAYMMADDFTNGIVFRPGVQQTSL